MRRMLLAVCMVAILNSVCYAKKAPKPAPAPVPASTSVPAPQPVAPPLNAKSVVGKVDSTIPIIGIDPPAIVVIDSNGEKIKCITNASTVKLSKDGEAILLRDFKKDDKVSIVYITNERGTHKALSIKVIE